jgi:hypothetical protein
VPQELKPLDPERLVELKTIEAACERVLAQERPDPSEWARSALREDVENLLVRVRAELDGGP